jgi:ABC-type multidrug transport system ATPase subunit
MTTKQLDIGYLPENLPLYNGLTVEQYLSFCSEIRGKNFNPQQFKDSFWHYLDISPLLKKNIGKLSRGQKQRVALVQSFLHQPKLVVLDEPTLGLDPQGIQNFKKFLKEISNEVSIIITGHVLSEMQSMCDHISILSQGKILKSIELKELSRYQTDFADLVLPKMEKISFDQLLDNDLQELQVEYEERMDDLVKMRLNFQKYTEDPKDFLSRLNKEKIQATEFSFVKNTLEEYYFGLNI